MSRWEMQPAAHSREHNMKTVSWLHLSDWHHDRRDKKIKFDRKIMLDQLITDIKNRTGINKRLKKIDFILFSGDIANRGAKSEFNRAKTELIDPIRKIVGTKTPIYCVPGNHDIERSRIDKISTEIKRQIANDFEQLNDVISDPATARELNKPLKNYFDLMDSLGNKASRSKLYAVHKLELHKIKIGLVCINTAWNSARFRLRHVDSTRSRPGSEWDYGLLRVTEAQLQQAIGELGDFDLGILMMHHPLNWLDELERARLEQSIFKHCHIVIHGHEHRPNTSQISNAFGNIIFIPAGATYAGRMARDPRYTNAYNFTTIDTETFFGTVYHRIWEEVDLRWGPDHRFWTDGKSEFALPTKKDYDLKLAHRATVNSTKQYIRFIDKRTHKSYEVTIKHYNETIDGENFIRQHISLKITLPKGPDDEFGWLTGIDPMIIDHPNEKVRARAYELMHVSPILKGKQPEKHLFSWIGTIDREAQSIAYEYMRLDLPNNFYYLPIRRFTDRLVLDVTGAPGYDYQFLPIGGLPKPHELEDRRWHVDTHDTVDLVLPSQSYIIQWRPKHKPVVEIKDHADAAAGA
jgi:predicted phosphodiesterase